MTHTPLATMLLLALVVTIATPFSSPSTGFVVTAFPPPGRTPPTDAFHRTRRRTTILDAGDELPPPTNTNTNTNTNTDEDGALPPVPEPPGYLSRVARTVASLRTMTDSVSPGDVIFARIDVPSSSIYADQGYDVVSIYHQGIDETTGRVDRLPVDSLDVPVPSGYTCYVRLYSPKYHGPYMEEGAVVATPEEVGLVSMRTEVNQSLLLAIPGLFWVFLCVSFVNIYEERYGGTFMDAFWGT